MQDAIAKFGYNERKKVSEKGKEQREIAFLFQLCGFQPQNGQNFVSALIFLPHLGHKRLDGPCELDSTLPRNIIKPIMSRSEATIPMTGLPKSMISRQ